MATIRANTSDSAWVQIASAKNTVLLQPAGDHYVHVGSAAPVLGDPGFYVPSKVSALFTVTTLGGGVWVIAASGNCSVTYATD